MCVNTLWNITEINNLLFNNEQYDMVGDFNLKKKLKVRLQQTFSYLLITIRCLMPAENY